MKNILRIIVVHVLVVCCASFTSGPIERSGTDRDALVKFGIIADIQYCDCDTRGSRYYRNSLQKLEEGVVNLNRAEVQFTVNLGDLVDRDTPKNMDSILVRLDKLNAPVFNLTGNHDYEGVQDNNQLYRQLGMPGEYYSFSQGDWRFIMLNTNEIASYANVAGTEKEEELELLLQKIAEEDRPNGAEYNGGISEKQLKWLEEELEKSRQESMNTLIFTHHPLYGVKGLTALNDLQVIELLSRYPIVKGVISGHHHAGAFGEYKGIPFITIEGMVETETTNAYGIVTLFPDKIEIKGAGRTTSRTIPLKKISQQGHE